MKEFELIKRIKNECGKTSAHIGIGDDAALFDNFLIAKDIMCEGIHFLHSSPLEKVIFKLFTANVSDISSMGGIAKFVLLGASLPEYTNLKESELAGAVKDAAEYYDVEVIGGDVTSSKSGIFFSLTVIGLKGENVLLRSGASAGEKVYLSKTLGLSKLSLENELTGTSVINPYYHYDITAEAELGQLLGKLKGVTSCIDISDGLGKDAYHVSENSGVKIVIEHEKLPLEALEGFNINETDYFINSGEEFALLFTGDDNVQTELEKEGIFVYELGVTEEGSGVYLKKDGKYTEISTEGYEHEWFKKKK